jgi:uncharacterized membrane protein YphA (DoxX/SURF4 family)
MTTDIVPAAPEAVALELGNRGILAEEAFDDLDTVQRRSSDRLSHLLGRALFGGYFLYNGINHFKRHEMLSGYAGSKGVPAPRVAVAVSGAMLLAGGASLFTGYRPRLGAAVFAGFLLGVSPVMHAFWKETDAQARTNESVNFLKNAGLLGGTLLAASHPEPWPVSL